MVTLFQCFHFNEEWYLVEMALTIPPKDIAFHKIVVPMEGVRERDWQTVLAEQFLNRDGTQRICGLHETPDNACQDSRVAFFLYKAGAQTLRTPYGDFPLNATEEAPERLKSVIEINEDYM